MEGFEVGYKTGSGNIMAITTYGVIFHRHSIPVGEPGLYCNNNGIVCGGYNGGCPPYSPAFDKLKKSMPYFYVICVEFDMAWASKYAGRRTGYFVLSYADRLTMNYIQRAIKHFESLGYYTVGASNCPGCHPKDCTVTRGGKCSKPKKRRFSMEATGVECQVLHQRMFDDVLPWWYRTVNYVPARMYRYAGVFTADKLDVMDVILENFVWSDKSFHNLIPEHSMDCYMKKIPEGKCDAGQYYLVYNLEDLK